VAGPACRPSRCSGKDLDHLLIGPAGAFAINTKHHPNARVTVKGRDALHVNGTWRPYLKDARRDAGAVQELLTTAGPIEVQAVVCLVDARLTVTTPGEAVHVVDVDDLIPWLTGPPEIVDAELVDRFYARARRADTWPGTPVPAAPDGTDALARDLAERSPAFSDPQPAEPVPAPGTTPVPTQRTRRTGRPADRPVHPTPAPMPVRQRRRAPSARSRGHGIDVVKGVLAFVALLAIVLAGPDRVTAVLLPLMDSLVHRFVTNNLPQPTGTNPALPVHAVGTACSVKGERARSALDGITIRCLPLPSAGGGLHWQHPKPGATASQAGR
jgi:hypothetical protein